MAESIDPPARVAAPLFPTFRRILRGRPERRWRHLIAAAQLPPPITDLLLRVVRRTRLWRREKRAVAVEFIAHFHDGLSAGESAERLVARFGDERAAAKLIRRSKRRNRPLLWHAWRYLGYCILLLIGAYALVLIRFVSSSPTIKVDYVANLNAETLNAAPDQRAWPLYRRAILALGMVAGREEKVLNDTYGTDADGYDIRLTDLRPTDAAWPVAAKYLADHADGLTLLRQAAARPQFGFLYGKDGSQNDAELGYDNTVRVDDALVSSLVGVLLPAINQVRQLATLLTLDLADAQQRHDGGRAIADIDALFGIAAHQQAAPMLLSRLVAMGVDTMAFEQMRLLLRDEPSLLSDAQWIALAHRVGTVGGDTPGSLIDVRCEQMSFQDLLQRSYSDNGHGDGILTPAGARLWGAVMHMGSTPPRERDRLELAAAFAASGAYSAVTSRKALSEEYERLMTSITTELSRPLRESRNDAYEGRLRQLRAAPLLRARLLPVIILAPSLRSIGITAERTLGQREGVEIGVALELFRRRQGRYPETLGELPSRFLPRLPVDRISGEPLHYRLFDGRPVVYSVGADRDDDGGRVTLDRKGRPQPILAADWFDQYGPPRDGDWVTLDLRPAAATQPSR